MDLYARIQESARYCRDTNVRKKINILLDGIKNKNVCLTCKRSGIDRSTYYRWMDRLVKADFRVESLKIRSSKPHHCPHQVSKRIVKLIKHYRFKYRYGSPNILFYLKQNHRNIHVSKSTIERVIKRNQWILRKYKTKKINPHKKRYALPWPGMCVQLDIKYVPKRIDGQQYYVFNAIDDCTRWRYFRAYKDKSMGSAVDFTKRLIEHAPFTIKKIQTDNDKAFTYRFSPYEDLNHPFVDYLNEQSIRHRLIPPGQKELNGKVERSHRIDDDEFYWKAPLYSFGLLQKHLHQWWLEYNYDRPHSGIEHMTPMEKWLERFLIVYLAIAPSYGIQTFIAKQQNVKSTTLETYLKYLTWRDSQFLPVADVLENYIYS